MSRTSSRPAVDVLAEPHRRADGPLREPASTAARRRASRSRACLLGTSTPIADLPGIGAMIRTSGVASAYAMSSPSESTFFTFVPCLDVDLEQRDRRPAVSRDDPGRHAEVLERALQRRPSSAPRPDPRRPTAGAAAAGRAAGARSLRRPAELGPGSRLATTLGVVLVVSSTHPRPPRGARRRARRRSVRIDARLRRGGRPRSGSWAAPRPPRPRRARTGVAGPDPTRSESGVAGEDQQPEHGPAQHHTIAPPTPRRAAERPRGDRAEDARRRRPAAGSRRAAAGSRASDTARAPRRAANTKPMNIRQPVLLRGAADQQQRPSTGPGPGTPARRRRSPADRRPDPRPTGPAASNQSPRTASSASTTRPMPSTSRAQGARCSADRARAGSFSGRFARFAVFVAITPP